MQDSKIKHLFGGNNDLPNGARVIEMKEGKREVETWIRLKGGTLINRIHYPMDFVKKGDPKSRVISVYHKLLWRVSRNSDIYWQKLFLCF